MVYYTVNIALMEDRQSLILRFKSVILRLYLRVFEKVCLQFVKIIHNNYPPDL